MGLSLEMKYQILKLWSYGHSVLLIVLQNQFAIDAYMWVFHFVWFKLYHWNQSRTLNQLLKLDSGPNAMIPFQVSNTSGFKLEL